MKRYCIGIVCLCYVIMTLAAPFPADAAAPDYELSVLYAQIFPADTTAYDPAAPSTASATSADSNDLPVLSDASAAKAGEIVVLTVGFRNNTASSVEIGSFGARLSYDKDKLELYNLFGNVNNNAYEIGADFASGWMTSPNVNANNNYVSVAAMALGNANALAANSQTVMARFAFQVKSGAADGVTQFTFDAAKSYVANGANQRFTLGAFTPFTLTVGGNAPAHEYAIGKLTRNGETISAEITNQSGAGGLLAIAAYSDTGKFLRCVTETVTESQLARGSAGNVAVTLDLSGAKTIRAFLLDAQTQRPLSRVCSESV